MTHAAITEVARWIRAAYPHEACGLLVGRTSEHAVEVVHVERAANLEIERAHERFRLAPLDWMRIEDAARRIGLDVVGIWHSHPDHAAIPSATDRASAWENCAHLIASVDSERVADWRAWQLEGGRFVEKTLEISADSARLA